MIQRRCRYRGREFCSQNPGAMNLWVMAGLSVLVLLFLGWLALRLRPEAKRETSAESAALRIYCASGMLAPVQEILDRYNREFGTKHEIVRSGGTGELAGQLAIEFETAGNLDQRFGGDIFVSADSSVLDVARREGRIAERFAVAYQRPVIAVAADSEVKIRDLRSLSQSELRYGICVPQAAVGTLVKQIAQRDGYWVELERRKRTDSPNVMNLAQAVVSGSLDAAVIWDSTVAQINRQSSEPRLKIAALADPGDSLKSEVELGVVADSPHPTAALRLARYMTAPELNREIWEGAGFQFIPGDPWEEMPQVYLHFGSMFTPVLEESLREFALREGINVYPRWEGCGKLVATMNATQDSDLFPDAFMACDMPFIGMVQEHFVPPVIVSSNPIVVAVAPNFAERFDSVEDLLKPGLRLGVCDPDQSALGLLTRQLFSEPPYQNWYQKIQEQAVVTVDVGPTLLSQLMAGGLDVAILYRSNVEADPNAVKTLKLLPIEQSALHSKAVQGWTVAKKSRHARLMQRLFDKIISDETQENFRRSGFVWEYSSSDQLD